MKTRLLLAVIITITFTGNAIANNGNNKKTTGIAVDKTTGNANSNNNSNGTPQGANQNGVINSNHHALPLQGNGGPVGVPIDGGASALLAAGAVYGLKKMRDYRKKNKKAVSAM